jgi:hypothetical protein
LATRHHQITINNSTVEGSGAAATPCARATAGCSEL